MSALTHHQMEMLLACVKHHMGLDLRLKVARELPLIYNQWVDQEVMVVHQIDEHCEGKP